MMTFKMSDIAQTLKVYNLRADTNEFIGEGDAYIPPHTGLPMHCTDIAPPEIPTGCVAVFNAEIGTWSIVEDCRGITVYSTDTGSAIDIEELGPLPENVTLIAPAGQFEKWDGTKWVKDEGAEKAAKILSAQDTKDVLLHRANLKIATLQDAVDLAIATKEETSLLPDWKKYRVLLNRVDTSTAQDIHWPVQPE